MSISDSLSISCKGQWISATSRQHQHIQQLRIREQGCAYMSITMMTNLRITVGQPILIKYNQLHVNDEIYSSSNVAVIAIVALLDSTLSCDDEDIVITPHICCMIDASTIRSIRSNQTITVKIDSSPSLIERASTIFQSNDSHDISIIALFMPPSSGVHSLLPIAHHVHVNVSLHHTSSHITNADTSQADQDLIDNIRSALVRVLRHRFVARHCVVILGSIRGYQHVSAVITSTLPLAAHMLVVTHATIFNIQIEDRVSRHQGESTSQHIISSHSQNVLLSHKRLPAMSPAMQTLSEMIALPLLYAKLYTQLCVECPRGLLLSGPPGCGKTWSVRTICTRLNVPIISIDGSDLFRSIAGEAEIALIEAFNSADQISESGRPVMIFIDEIDVLCPHRSSSDTSSTDRLTAQLLTLMDGVKPRRSMLICGATNHPNAIDRALRRPGRFDREIEMTVPNVKERYDILTHYTCHMNLSDDVDLNMLARRCIGYVGADLEALTREAALYAIKRINLIDYDVYQHTYVSKHDFEYALNLVPASSQRSALAFTPASIDIDDGAFRRLAGLDDVIERLQRVISWPIKYADTFTRLNIRSVRGILLHGPPGSGKTSLVKSIASHQSMALLTLDVSAVFDSHVGEAERIMRAAFDKARRNSPCVLFIDEIDAMVHNRDHASEDGGGSGIEGRIVSTLLNEMDGVHPMTGVLVIGATNRLDRIDSALLRPGRFDEIILVDKPNLESSIQIWHHFIRNMEVGVDVMNHITDWASRCCGFTGAEIRQVVHEAAMSAMRDNMNAQYVDVQHFETAIRAIPR